MELIFVGTSHFKSDVRGWDGTETIRGFTAISATTLTDGTASIGGGYIEGATEVSATTLTDGTISISGGNFDGATEVSATTLTDGTASMSGGAISGLTGAISTPTNVTMSGVLSGATNIRATNYLKLGDEGFLFLGKSITNVEASIIAAASALVTTASLKGSLFISASPVGAWVFTATNTAATLSGLGV